MDVGVCNAAGSLIRCASEVNFSIGLSLATYAILSSFVNIKYLLPLSVVNVSLLRAIMCNGLSSVGVNRSH